MMVVVKVWLCLCIYILMVMTSGKMEELLIFSKLVKPSSYVPSPGCNL